MINKFREDGYGNILKYNHDAKAYVFYCKGGNKTLRKLEGQQGKYA